MFCLQLTPSIYQGMLVSKSGGWLVGCQHDGGSEIRDPLKTSTTTQEMQLRLPHLCESILLRMLEVFGHQQPKIQIYLAPKCDMPRDLPKRYQWKSESEDLKHFTQLFLKVAWNIISSWWLNQPIWKICSSNWDHFPRDRGENSQNVWVATT